MTFIPRPYQIECGAAVCDHLNRFDSTLIEIPTGGGKTIIFATLARDWPARVMIIAHREELVRQAAEKVLAISGVEPGVEMADARVDETRLGGKPRIVVASVQTLVTGRQAKFDPAEFGLLVIDEAHHAVAKSYRTVIAHFRRNERCKVLGVTATPKRADEIALGQVFESVAYRYGIVEAIEDGWLVPVHQQVVQIEGLDFSKVRDIAGDFHEAELEAIVSEESTLHKVAAPTVELAGDRPCLVFCVTVNHARLMAAVLERYRPHATAWLCGETDRQTRAQTVDAFRAGNLQFLCSVGLFCEGFDAPATAVVAMARPTKSPVVYAQALGRATRPLPGLVDGLETAEERREAIAQSAKKNMLALDFAGNSGRHKIVTAADVLGGKYGTPVRDYARQNTATENRPVPVAEALDRAEAELDLLAEERERRRRIVARAEYTAREVSPFDRRQVWAGGGNGPAPGPDPATDAQVRHLVWLGVKEATARRWTKVQASTAITRIRREKGLPVGR